MKIHFVSLFCLILFLFTACEKEFIPDTGGAGTDIVVEGYIEAGDRAAPPYVILTRSLPFFSEIEAGGIENNFVHDAVIRVSNGDQTVVLTELCLDQLTPEQRQLAGQLFGFDADDIGFNFCAYLDLSFAITGEEGRTYDLEIQVDEQVLTAATTIPQYIPLDTLWFEAPPGEPNDTLAQLRCQITDPPGRADFYRYLTKINDQPFLSPISSVTDDRFFDGKSFEFPLSKAEPRTVEFDPATYGLFHRGDTATIKWATLDEAHFNFWNTLEFNSNNQGPFSSYTRVDGNVEGGLGIWGGLSAGYYTLPVPEE